MEHKWKIGDEFRILQEKTAPRHRCKFPNKSFIVTSISKSGRTLFYEDKRTNVKCKGNHCETTFSIKWNDDYKMYTKEKKHLKEISNDLCILVRSKLQRERETIFNLLNI